MIFHEKYEVKNPENLEKKIERLSIPSDNSEVFVEMINQMLGENLTVVKKQ